MSRMSVEKTAALDVVKVMNKHVLNPAILRLAGRKHFYASAIRHTGRRTGKEYRTPIVAERVADGFVVPLPHGASVDWVRNLSASGHGALTQGGTTYSVISPAVVCAKTAEAEMPPKRRRFFERMNVESYLHLDEAIQ